MSIINVLSSKFPFKYFYSCVDGKEYIFSADKSMQMNSCVYWGKTGKIIMNTLNNVSNILETIEKYINLINDVPYTNSNDNNSILDLLRLLNKDLLKTNCNFFSSIHFEVLYSEQYREICNFNKMQEENIIEINKKLPLNNKDSTFLKRQQIASYLSINYSNKKYGYFKNFVSNKLNILYHAIKEFERMYSELSKNGKFDFKYTKEKIETIEEFKSIYEFYAIKSYNIFVKFDENQNIPDFANALSNNKSALLNYKLIQCFEFDNIMDLIKLSFIHCINSKVHVNHCLNCGKYFLTSKKSDEKYCDNISPENKDKTCKEIGPKKFYQRKIQLGDIESEFHKTKTCLAMRITRAKKKKKGIKKYQNRYNKFMREFEIKSKELEAKKFTEDELVKWIQNQKK